MRTTEAIELLTSALEDPTNLLETIERFQASAFAGSLQGEKETVEILQELAVDLDYYEPNDLARKEDPSYLDDKQALLEIASALKRIERERRLSSLADEVS